MTSGDDPWCRPTHTQRLNITIRAPRAVRDAYWAGRVEGAVLIVVDSK